MHIFLSILSVIGFVLLIILLVIIALIALILFLPIVYRVKVLKNGNFMANGSVRWLFGALSFKFAFEQGKLNYGLRIFGVPIKKLQKNSASFAKEKSSAQGENPTDKSENSPYQPAKKQPTIKPGEIISDEVETDEIRKDEPASDQMEVKSKADEIRSDEIKAKISFVDKIKFKIKGICDKLKKVKSILDLISKIKKPVIKLIKSIMPKKVKGYINFGFDDPSRTGMVYAVLGALCIPIPKDLELNPDFQNSRFECDVKISGRIFVIQILICIISLFKIPEFREILGFKPPKNRSNKKRRRSDRKRVKNYKSKIRQGGKHD
jgi:hypothetical protein